MASILCCNARPPVAHWYIRESDRNSEDPGSNPGWISMSFFTMVGIHEFCFSCLAPDDYTALTTVVTFTDTVTTQSLSIDIVDDLVFESTEHFNISLSTSSDGCNISPGNAIVPVYVMDDGEMLHNSHCKHEYKKLHYTYLYLIVTEPDLKKK